MTLAQDFEDFVQLLNKHKVAYMVVGGYALAFHGKPWLNKQAAGRSQDLVDIKEIRKKQRKKT